MIWPLAAVESACVEFIDENGGGPGVRFQRAELRIADLGAPRSFEAFVDESSDDSVFLRNRIQ